MEGCRNHSSSGLFEGVYVTAMRFIERMHKFGGSSNERNQKRTVAVLSTPSTLSPPPHAVPITITQLIHRTELVYPLHRCYTLTGQQDLKRRQLDISCEW